MNRKEDFIHKVEAETNKKASWVSSVEFFADNKGNRFQNGAFIFQIGYCFYVSDGNNQVSFFAPDINFKDIVKKKDALDFLDGKTDRLKNTSLFFSLFSDCLNSYEFEGGYTCFVKIKGNQLNQLIDVAISKQKYSLSEYNRLHPIDNQEK